VVRLAEVEPPPLPSPEWTRVKPILSGICGSDLATITAQGSPYFSPLTSTPFVFGHEVVGVVGETGENVTSVRTGDRVCLAPPLHCAIRGIDDPCAACQDGDLGHCRNVTRGVIGAGIQTGYCRDTGGGWSQGFVAHQSQLHRVPDALSDAGAVLVEPFACCLNSVQQAPLDEDDTVVVFGCGTIGALTIAALRYVGPSCQVIAIAKYPYQAEVARRLGADLVLPTGGGMRDRLARAVGAELLQPEIGPPVAIGGAAVVFDCVGSGTTIDDAMRFTQARGTIIVVGMPGVPRGIDWTAMWHKELEVRGSYTADADTFDRTLALATELDDQLAPLVGARFSLADYREGIQCALEAGRRGVTKVAFEIHDTIEPLAG
jgi:threonine dehydrogenase-like Zn-dependent dehydrogenase